MEAVADEEGNHDNILDARQAAAISDARVLFHENGVDFRVKPAAADQFHLPLDGLPRVLIVAGAVAGDEQGCVGRPGRARKGVFFNDVAGAGQ